MWLTIGDLRELQDPIAIEIDNQTPRLVTIREGSPGPRRLIFWTDPAQLNPDGGFRAQFELDVFRPGIRIQARIAFPRTRLEEVALILRQRRKNQSRWPEEEFAETLRTLPYDPTRELATLLEDYWLGYSAAASLLRLDSHNGLPIILKSQPQFGFKRFLSDYSSGLHLFQTEAYDAAKRVLEARTTGVTAIEAIKVLSLTGSDLDFQILERYANLGLVPHYLGDQLSDVAEGALARLGSKPHLDKIEQELHEAKKNYTFDEALRLSQILRKAELAGKAELSNAICPHLWSLVNNHTDVILDPAGWAASALQAIERNQLSPRGADLDKWKQTCQTRGFGPPN